jgi:hypothetical protein
VITPTRLRTIATGPSAVVAASADGGHIVTVPLRGHGTGLLHRDAVREGRHPFRGRQADQPDCDRPGGGGCAQRQFGARLAAYSVFTRCEGSSAELHLLDLITGKDVMLATDRGSLYRDLAMGRRGLVYVVNHLKDYRSSSSSGKLVFVPTVELLRLARG